MQDLRSLCAHRSRHCSGAYCASVIISLLDLPLAQPPGRQNELPGLSKLTDGLAEYLSRCE